MAAELIERSQFGSLLNDVGLFGTGVEVGAYRGDFARQVLDRWRGERWFLVDPWAASDAFLVRNGGVVWQMDEAFRAAMQLSADDPRAEIVKLGDSKPEISVPDLVDAVYIDGMHDTASTLADLEHWWPRVKPGGIVAGHDYLDQWRWSSDINAGVLFGVKTAVDRFARLQERIACSTSEEFPTWWFRKPVGRPTSVGVVSGSTADVPWREIARANHRRYCERNGYAYYHAALKRGDRAPNWEKLSVVRAALDESEWVMWIDADAIFLDPAKRLEQFWDGRSSFVWMKDDINGLNTGVFFARRCEETTAFLNEWEALSDDARWRNDNWTDNGAAMELERQGRLPGLAMPHRAANSYPHFDGKWGPDDFVVHCAGLLPPVRMALLQDLAVRADLAFSNDWTGRDDRRALSADP